MEGFGSELKQKLKAAIKDKLIETGHYVDDQLPTYIMVMVTNRRSKKEMDKELTLFLGDDTDSFTTWLLSIFKMLDDSTECSSSGTKRMLSSASSDTEKKKTKKKKIKYLDESSSLLDDKVNNTTKTQEATTAPSVSSSPPPAQQQTTVLSGGVDHDEIAPAEAVSNSSEDSGSTAASLKGRKIDNRIREKPKGDSEEEEDFLNIKEEDIEDFLNETEEAIEKKQCKTVSRKPPKLSRQAIRIAQKSILEAIGSTPSSSALLDENKNSGNTGGNKRGEKKIVCSSTIGDLEKQQPSTSAFARSKKSEGENLFKSKEDDYVDAREFINRKRGLVSSKEHQPSSLEKRTSRKNAQEGGPAVGKSSCNKESDSDSDSFYESKHKEGKGSAITGVRSRKGRSSSVEFVPSSESNASGRGTKRTVMNMNKRYDYRETASATVVGTDRSDDQVKRKRGGKQLILSEVVADQSGEAKRRTVKSVANVAPIPPRPKLQLDECNASGSSNLVRKAFAEVERSLNNPKQRIPVKKQQNVEANSNSNQNVRKPEMPQKDASPIKLITKKCVQQGKKIPHSLAEKMRYERENSRVVEIDLSSDEEEHPESIGVSQSSSKNSYYKKEEQQLTAGTAQQIKLGSSKKDEKLDTAIQKATLRAVAAAANVFRTAVPVATAEVEEYDPLENSPQFVVTLNGVDPGKFMQMDEEEEEDVSTFSAMSNDVDMNMEQVTDTRTAATTATVSKKKLERCKFWPACLNGENCPYIHPSSACKMFPNCKFGKSCIFIHPKCKFDSACTRFDCSYSHTDEARHTAVTSGATAKASATFKPPCKYFPNCTNIACPFQHPKLCRFDKYCLNKNCQFTHTGPSSYTKSNMSGDKLKWTNPKLYSLVNVSSAAATTVNPQSQPSTTTAAATAGATTVNPQS